MPLNSAATTVACRRSALVRWASVIETSACGGAPQLDGCALGDTLGEELSAEAEEGEVSALVVAVGPGLAEVRDRHQGQGGLARVDELPADTEPVEDTRAEALDHDVRGVEQPTEDVARAFGFQIENEGALVGVEVVEGAALLGVGVAAPEGGEGARGIAAWTLDLDHVRAVVAQQLGRVGPRDELGEVQNRGAVEGTGHSFPPAIRSRAAERGARCRSPGSRLKRRRRSERSSWGGLRGVAAPP
jgi:hypothetical protein